MPYGPGSYDEEWYPICPQCNGYTLASNGNCICNTRIKCDCCNECKDKMLEMEEK